MNDTPQPPTEDTAERDEDAGHSFYPFHVIDTLIIAHVLGGILLTLAILHPFHLHEPADPLKTPPGIKPEWYFLSMYQGLKYIPGTITIPWLTAEGEEGEAAEAAGEADSEGQGRKIDIAWVGVLASGGIFAAIIIWPFIDALKGGWRRIHVPIVVVGIVIVLFLALTGNVSWVKALIAIAILPLIDALVCLATASRRFHVVVGTVAILGALLFGFLGHISERTIVVGGQQYEIDHMGVPHASSPEDEPTTEP